MKRIFSLLLCISLAFGTVICAEESTEAFESCALYVNGEKIASCNGDERLPIGSVSKSFTAAIILKLCEEGKISFDEPAVSYLSEFTMNDERYKDITVRMLLNHTSGIYGSTLKNAMLYGEYSAWNHDNILSLLSEQRLKNKPGETSSYCNDGYSVLEILAERVTGESFDSLIKKYITVPLALSDTVTGSEYKGEIKDIVSATACGGMISTSEELCVFGYSLLSDNGLLTENSRNEMTKSYSEDEGTSDYGLGLDDVSMYPFDKLGIKACCKGGDTLYHSTSLVILPELGITASFSAKNSSSLYCRAEAVKIVIDYLSEYMGIDVEYYDAVAAEKKDKGDIEEYKKYEGLYVSNAGEYKFKISGEYGILEDLYRGTRIKYEYIGGGNFAYRGEILYFDGDALKKRGMMALNGNFMLPYNYCFAQKKTDGGKRSAAWDERNGKIYLICDEVYNSALLMSGLPLTSIFFADGVTSYVGYMKITGDNEAVADLNISGGMGRDLSDVSFFTKDEKEYVKAQGWIFTDSSSVPDIYDGMHSVATIAEDGFIKWYRVGSASGKTLTADIPENSGITVYNAKGETVFSSLSENHGCVLPENGYIAFAGAVGAQFKIMLN